MGGVLDPQGPIGAAERLILVNATVVMLAVIVPVIVLTLGFAWWFRAGNTKARYMPDWEYSGPVELVVWSIPALVVVFLGGMAWIGSHDLDPPKPIASATAKPLEIQVVSLDWKWLFIYPEQGVASVNRLVVPAGHAAAFQHHLVGRDEQLLRAAARQPDLHHGRHDDAALPAGRQARHLPRPAACSSAATASPTCASTSWRSSPPRSTTGCARPRVPAARSIRGATADAHQAGHRLAAVDLRHGLARPVPGGHSAGGEVMLGKLTWDAIPFDQPIPFATSLVVIVVLIGVALLHLVEGLVAVPVARVDHQRRPQAHRRHVRPARPGDAGARLHRRADDAQPAGDRGRQQSRATCRPSTTTRSSRPTARS